MDNKFQWAIYKAQSAKSGTADSTLSALAESLEAIAQGLDEQSKTQNQTLQLLLNKLN